MTLHSKTPIDYPGISEHVLNAGLAVFAKAGIPAPNFGVLDSVYYAMKKAEAEGPKAKAKAA